MKANSNTIFLALLVAGCLAAPAFAADEIQTVATAKVVLEEIMQIPENAIPPWLLKKAHAVAIIPDVLKAGFVVNARHGHGVILVRNEHGTWSMPIFLRVSGGGVGFQAGVQSTDLILVFKGKRSVDRLLEGRNKFTLGGDASIAAGPVGRHSEAGTDLSLKAEVYSYSRSRGIFAGVALTGTVIKVESNLNANFYARPSGITPEEIIRGDNLLIPPVAVELHTKLTESSGELEPPQTPANPPANPKP